MFDIPWSEGLSRAARDLWNVNLEAPEFQPLLTPPQEARYGEAASGVAFKLAKTLKKSPKAIAEELAAKLTALNLAHLLKVDVAGAGYLNFTATPELYHSLIRNAIAQGSAFGRNAPGSRPSVLLEHTSANPTGPLHIAHGRQAAVGDSIGNLLEAVGHPVTREYYINDTGNQMKQFALSVHARYRQVTDPNYPFPENGYLGEYVTELGRKIHSWEQDKWVSAPMFKVVDQFARIGCETMLQDIRQDLQRFRVKFDHWYSEESLRSSGRIEALIEEFKKRGLLERKEDAVYLRTLALGDTQDWVLVKSNGEFTYRTPDFAYHRHKFERGFNRVINLLGPDHKAHADTMKIVMSELGYPELDTVLIQHCRLLRGDEEVKMSKRAATYVTLSELLDEVGTDATRWFFVMRSTSSHLDFDMEIAKKQTLDNPVYYVQNAHARICTIWKKGVEKGLIPADAVVEDHWKGPLEDPLLRDPEIRVLREILKYPRALEVAARNLEPSILCTYLYETAAAFHGYYQNRDNIILSSDPRERMGRMGMCATLQAVLHNGLALLGVSAPARMEKLDT